MGLSRNEKYIKAFGRNLKKLRESKDIPQESLAFKCEVARSQVVRLENGEQNPTISTLLVLAKGLGVEPKKLLDFDF